MQWGFRRQNVDYSTTQYDYSNYNCGDNQLAPFLCCNSWRIWNNTFRVVTRPPRPLTECRLPERFRPVNRPAETFQESDLGAGQRFDPGR